MGNLCQIHLKSYHILTYHSNVKIVHSIYTVKEKDSKFRAQ